MWQFDSFATEVAAVRLAPDAPLVVLAEHRPAPRVLPIWTRGDMGLDASTLEWIRRLPETPDSRDVAALRVLRRNASESGDVRLLDSLLVRINETERACNEAAAAERRLAYLMAQQTTDGRDQLKREREQAMLRLAKSLVEGERISPDTAERRAKETLGQLWAETDRRVAEEAEVLRARLASQSRR